MPFPGAGEELAAAFGFEFLNGFATDTTGGLFPGEKKELDLFNHCQNTLSHHAITAGRNQHERVEQVATFTGQAFRIPTAAQSLLSFDGRYEVLLPDTAWKFNQQTLRLPAKGLSQGAVLSYGKGKVAIFGEAAMFTAQIKGPNRNPFGLNSPDATQNAQFLLNLMHWLDGKLDNGRVETRSTKKDSIYISGTRFLFPLFERWVHAYQRNHPEQHFAIKAKIQNPAILATAAPVKRETLPTGKLPTVVSKFAILPVINENHPLADSLVSNGFSKETLATIYFKNSQHDERDLKSVVDLPHPLRIYSRQACAAVSFASHFNRDAKDIVNHGNAIENDGALLETVLNDSLGLAFLDLSGIYDLQSREVKKGIRIVPIDLDNDGIISADENFYESLDKLLSKLETKQVASMIPVGEVTIINNDIDNQDVQPFIDWIQREGQQYVHQEGYLRHNVSNKAVDVIAKKP